MGGVENNGVAGGFHNLQAAHVNDKIVIAKAAAAFTQADAVIARAAGLGQHMAHLPGRKELPLLDIHRLVRSGSGQQQIGLAAEECRDLQHVHCFGHGYGLFRQMDIRDDGDVITFPHFRQD